MNENWYIVDSEDAAAKMAEMFWEFHDFRIAEVKYVSKKEQIDLLLEYDSDNLRILLRFEKDIAMNFIPEETPGNDWLSEASLRIIDYDKIVWIAGDCGDINPFKEQINVFWIAGRRLIFAIVNENGKAIALPDDILHQQIQSFNYTTRRYDVIKRDFNPTKYGWM